MYRWIGSRGGSRSTTKRRASGDDGFTLLEVLIAFAILAVMLVPLLQVFGGSLGGTDVARIYAEGAMLARSKLTEVAAADNLEEGETSGNFGDGPYRWRAAIERDTSEVTLPDDTAVGVPASARSRFGFGGRSGHGGFGSASSGFGRGSRSSGSGSNFGSSRSSGSGGRSGSSGFGSSTGTFGRGGSGSSSFGAGTSTQSTGGNAGSTTATGTGTGTETRGNDEAEAEISAQLVPLRVTVTVEWGKGRSGGEVSLSTDRVGREAAPVPGTNP